MFRRVYILLATLKKGLTTFNLFPIFFQKNHCIFLYNLGEKFAFFILPKKYDKFTLVDVRILRALLNNDIHIISPYSNEISEFRFLILFL